MESKKEQFESLCNQMKKLIDHINLLKQNPFVQIYIVRCAERQSNQTKMIDGYINILKQNLFVQRYIELCKERQVLFNAIEKLYKDIKMQEYENCDHLGIICDYHGEREIYGCIKCGLNQKVQYEKNKHLSFTEKLMKAYLKKYKYIKFKKVKNLSCDLELAMDITKKIREAHPDISDQDLIEYFKNSLEYLRKTSVSEESVESQIQRLSLNPN